MKPPSELAMSRVMLRSKIHRATLSRKALDYEGSIALDRHLMDAADLLPGEQVHVLNLNTGSRLVTYVIEAPAHHQAMGMSPEGTRRTKTSRMPTLIEP